MKRFFTVLLLLTVLLSHKIMAQNILKEGDMFSDFSVLQDLENPSSRVSLSKYVGKGKWVIADFWASWCGPCREEIPFIREAYRNLPMDKVTVLSIAIWDELEKTKSAAKDLGIEWEQIVNGGDTVPEIYGVTGIPYIILFAPDGRIDKIGLRGKEILNYTASRINLSSGERAGSTSGNHSVSSRQPGKSVRDDIMPQSSDGIHKITPAASLQSTYQIFITRNGVGPITLGMPLKEVKEKSIYSMYPIRQVDDFAGRPVYRMLKDTLEGAFEERVDLFCDWPDNEEDYSEAESLSQEVDDALVKIIMVCDKNVTILGTSISVGMSFQELLRQPGIKKLDEKDFTYRDFNCRIIVGKSGTVEVIFVTFDTK